MAALASFAASAIPVAAENAPRFGAVASLVLGMSSARLTKSGSLIALRPAVGCISRCARSIHHADDVQVLILILCLCVKRMVWGQHER